MSKIISTDVEKLAQLARISGTDEERQKFKAELEAILKYVEEVKEASLKETATTISNINVLREDGQTHESGIYTDALLKLAPQSLGGFIKVKKII